MGTIDPGTGQEVESRATGALTVVVATDPVGPPREAERSGAELARASGADLELLIGVASSVTRSVVASMDDRCATWRATGVRNVRWRASSGGRPASVIAERSKGPDAVVLCMEFNSRHAAPSLLMSSVTEEVLRRSAAPILLAGPHLAPSSGPRDHIVAAVDDSVVATAACSVAQSLADLTGADLRIVRIRPADENEEHPSRPEEVDAVVLVIDAENRAAAIVGTIDEPGRTLLVLGGHRGGGKQRFALGEVALDAVRQATCPVLVVPSAAVGSALTKGPQALSPSTTRPSAPADSGR